MAHIVDLSRYREARKPAPHGEFLIRIDQRINELADTLFRHTAECVQRAGRDRIPRQQGDDVRHQGRRHARLGLENAQNLITVARSKRRDLLQQEARRPVGPHGQPRP